MELEKIIMQSAEEVGLRCENLEKLDFPARETGSRSNLRSQKKIWDEMMLAPKQANTSHVMNR